MAFTLAMGMDCLMTSTNQLEHFTPESRPTHSDVMTYADTIPQFRTQEYASGACHLRCTCTVPHQRLMGIRQPTHQMRRRYCAREVESTFQGYTDNRIPGMLPLPPTQVVTEEGCLEAGPSASEDRSNGHGTIRGIFKPRE